MTKQTGIMWLLGHSKYRGEGCLDWPFSKVRGYGTLGVKGKIYKAHRMMCELAHGEPPTQKHEAAHSCGNHGCVNPKHLAWKTRSENQTESVAMGRMWTGGRRGKVDRQKVQQIRALKGRLSQDKIAKQFGVTHSTIAKIHRGETWRNV